MSNTFDKDLHEVVYFRLERTMRQVNRYTRRILSENKFDLSIDQWVLLKRISESEKGLHQMELSNSTFRDPAAITRTLDLLNAKGLVDRLPDAHDRRAHLLFLTPKGLELVKTMTPLIKEIRAKGLEGFSESQITSLKSLLDKLYQNILDP